MFVDVREGVFAVAGMSDGLCYTKGYGESRTDISFAIEPL